MFFRGFFCLCDVGIHTFVHLQSLSILPFNNLRLGAINIKYENSEFKNGNIEKESGKLKVKFRQKGVSIVRKWCNS